MAQEILFGSLGLGVVMLGIFLFFSLDSLSYNQIGINYSSYFKSIENKTYYAGYHFIGLGHDFISYDLTISTMEFSNSSTATLPPISCRTKDGLKLDLEISFQYRVQREKIYDIYTTFGSEMKNVLLRVAIDSISDTATRYSSANFFLNRSSISDSMSADLNERLSKNLSCELVFFQLRSISLPDPYEDAIEQTEVTKQGILKASALRQKNLVVQQMYVESANITKEITINKANGTAEALKVKADANAGTFLNFTTKQAEAYSYLKGNLSLTNEYLIEYLQLNLVQSSSTGNLVIALRDQNRNSSATSV